MKMKLLALSLALTLGAAPPAFAEGSVKIKRVGGWQVGIDPSLGNGCFITTFVGDSTALRLGLAFTNGAASIYLALSDPDWKSLELGKDYPLEIEFDGREVWKPTATVVSMDGGKFLAVQTRDTRFALDFSRKLAVRIFFQGRKIVGVKLKDSFRAVDEMLNCQEEVKKYAAKPAPAAPSDPFKAPQETEKAADPFDL